ncbi:MAG: hypothetical protein JWQ76_3509 [Ramlibacter sp.]|nr:hypothetical protein [Ramlibacter sp.]
MGVMGAKRTYRPVQAFCLALALACLVPASAGAQGPALDAPNVVVISDTLVTSGQPTATALAGLKGLGIEAVVSLGPRGGLALVPDEPAIVASQGIEYIAIPFPPDGPSEAQYDAVADALRSVQGRRTLLHCQVNWQASTFLFLYRVVEGKEDPELAYQALATVWSPSGPWKQLLVTQLRKRGIAFDPY